MIVLLSGSAVAACIFSFRHPSLLTEDGVRIVAWGPYSSSSLEEGLTEGKTVLVYIYTQNDVHHAIMWPNIMASPAINTAIIDNEIVAMKGDTLRGDVNELRLSMKDKGYRGLTPTIAIFRPDKPAYPAVVKCGYIPPEQINTVLVSAIDNSNRALR